MYKIKNTLKKEIKWCQKSDKKEVKKAAKKRSTIKGAKKILYNTKIGEVKKDC